MSDSFNDLGRVPLLLNFDFLLDLTVSECMSVQAQKAEAGDIGTSKFTHTYKCPVHASGKHGFTLNIQDSKLYRLPETPAPEREWYGNGQRWDCVPSKTEKPHSTRKCLKREGKQLKIASGSP